MGSNDTLDTTANRAAADYMGGVAWPTVFLGIAVTTGFATILLMIAAGSLSLWLAVPGIGFLSYVAYTVLHESVHGSISGNNRSLRWLNDLLGYLMGQLLFIPATAHRHEHRAHHRHTNNSDADPDYAFSGAISPLNAIKVVSLAISTQHTYYFKNCWAKARLSENLTFVAETLFAFAWRLAFMAQGLWLEGMTLFLLGGGIGFLLLIYFFAYIVHRPYEDEGRYLDTATVVIPGMLGKVLTLLWGFQNFHSIHHLFPRVPFYKYEALFNEIEPIMEKKGARIYRLGMTGLKPRLALN